MRWRAQPLTCYLLSYVVGPIAWKKAPKRFSVLLHTFSQLLSGHVDIVVERISLVAPNPDTPLILLLLAIKTR